MFTSFTYSSSSSRIEWIYGLLMLLSIAHHVPTQKAKLFLYNGRPQAYFPKIGIGCIDLLGYEYALTENFYIKMIEECQFH